MQISFILIKEKEDKKKTKATTKQKEKKCTANEYKLMIYEKTQEYENINTYRTIKMMMERKNSKKEPAINISLACAASSYPQIHRLFEKQKTSSPAKRFRWLYVRVCWKTCERGGREFMELHLYFPLLLWISIIISVHS